MNSVHNTVNVPSTTGSENLDPTQPVNNIEKLDPTQPNPTHEWTRPTSISAKRWTECRMILEDGGSRLTVNTSLLYEERRLDWTEVSFRAHLVW